MTKDGDGDIDVAHVKKLLIGTKASDITDRSEFLSHFQSTYQLLIAKETVDKTTILLIDTVTIWLLRGSQYARLKNYKFVELEVSPQLLIRLFQFICDYFDTGLGALSNAMTALLQRLCLFSGDVASEGLSLIHLRWLDSVLGLPITLKSYHVIVESIAKDPKLAKMLIERQPDFGFRCIDALQYNGLANVVSKAFGTVYSGVYGNGEEFLNSWQGLTIEGLLNDKTRSNIASHLLPNLFKGNPDLYLRFFHHIRGQDYNDDVFLAVAKIGHTIVANFDELDEFDTFLQTLYSTDSRKRLDALEVIVGCVRSTKLTNTNILQELLSPQLLDVFFKESSTPQLRNRFVTLMNKALISWRDYVSNCEKRNKNGVNENTKDGVELTKNSIQSINDYVQGQFAPSRSYSQLVLASDFLQMFIDQEFDGVARQKSKHQKTKAKMIEVFSPGFIQVILRMSSNNYEDIRLRATQMLKGCPYDLFSLSGPEYNQYFNNTMDLLSSQKGRQSDSAAQVFLTLTEIYQKSDLGKVEHLLETIHKELTSRISLSISIHGFLTAFSYILNAATDNLLKSKHTFFKSLINSLLDTLELLWKTTKAQLVTASSEIVDAQSNHWREIKESSGLLESLMRINVNNNSSFFAVERLLSVCDILMDQLTTVTHRGAISAIHPTFVEACRICMESGLSRNLSDWLLKNLNVIKTHTQLISRRSGGLPYLITAVLHGMAFDLDRLHTALLDTVAELLTISSVPYIFDGSETMDIPQVHALNCLKHIIGESFPVALQDQHISSALEISLRNLDHESWSMKNAAVMLFTALQIKIFGSNKMGNILPQMNAPLFFLKYPGVSQILLHELETSYNKVDVVIPILTILSRLASHKPDDVRVGAFIEILENRYLGHKVWKVRELTSLTISSLVHPTKLEVKAVQLSKKFSERLSNNYCHGVLLCITSLTERLSQSNLASTLDISQTISYVFEKLSSSTEIVWPILSACAKLLGYGEPTEGTIVLVRAFLTKQLQNSTEYPDALRRLCLKSCAELLIRVDFAADDVQSMVTTTSLVFQHEIDYEVLFTYLEFWEDATSQSNLQNYLKSFNLAHVSALVQTLAERLLQEGSWNYVTEKVLNFLVSRQLPFSLGVATSHLNPEVQRLLFFLDINTGTCQDLRTAYDLIEKYAGDDQLEDTQISSIYAADMLIRQSKDEAISAKAFILLFKMLFDGSSDVRNAASHILAKHMDLDSAEVVTNSKKFIAFYIGKFPSHSQAILEEECHSINKNLADANLDLECSQYEVESDNLYIDEVDYHKLVMNGLSNCDSDHFFFRCAEEIKMVSEHISSNLQKIITTWTYNQHLDTAIAKAFNYAIFRKSSVHIEDSLLELAQKLQDLGYPEPVSH